jgi:hypothetical protein
MSSSAPGTGIVHNRNYPAYKSLRKSGANPADWRQFSGIVSGANRFRKDASLLFPVVGSIGAPGALHIPPTHFSRANWKDQDRVPAKMETTH